MRISSLLLACALVLQVSNARAQTYTWSVFAGLGPQLGSTDGLASEARFYNPNSLIADAAGNLYVTDTFNHTIRKIAPDGSVTTLAGSARNSGTANGTGATARFSSPNGIALDASGNLFVADRSNHAIRKITPAGVVTTFAGLAGTAGSVDGAAGAARFTTPSGLTIDRDGNLFVGDTGNHAVRRITPDGVVTTVAGALATSGNTDGAAAAARFNGPNGLIFDTAGNLLIADSGNHTIRRLDRDGTVTTFAGTAGISGTTSATGTAARFNFPTGLTFDAAGNLFVADSSNDCIRRITPAGVVTVFAGGPDVRGSANGTGTAARFYSPYGIAIGPDGNLFVADTLNHTVRKITPAAVVSNHSGPGGTFGNANGTGTAARFNYPQGLAIDPENNLYVADWRNAMVRKVTPARVVTNYQAFTSPHGIAWGSGVLTVTERVSHFIRMYSLTSAAFLDIGTTGVAGSTDGTGTTGGVLFNQPYGVCVDSLNRLVIADTGNHTLRLISNSTGVLSVVTLVGAAGVSGATSGVLTTARLSSPRGVTSDRGANYYIADTGSHTIRKVTYPSGAVTTLAGLAFSSGTNDGTGSTARFNSPEGIAADSGGVVYVADRFNHAIRRITPSGLVTTIGGLPSVAGFAEGPGTNSRFYEPTGIVVDTDGNLYVTSAAANVIMRGVLDQTPVITTPPQAAVLAIGNTLSLSVVATGTSLTYQWKLEGTALPGATASTYTVANAQASHSGRYTVDVSNSAGTATSIPVQISVQANVEVSRIVNLAIRSQAGTDAQTLIVGVGIGGAGTLGSKPILIRGIGPTLGAFGVAGVLADPKLELYSGATKVNENDNWAGDTALAAAATRVGAFALSNAASRDAALYLPTLAAGSYSVQITGGTGGGGSPTGIALAEVYDATPAGTATAATPRLTNVSARTQVGTDGDILIAGFVIAGQTSKNVLIRAIGPTLGSFGVAGVLADPKLELYDAKGKITENDNWGGTPQLSSTFFSVGAFPLTATSRDAVLLVTLAPGSYTAQISGVNATTGVALVEVYEVP